MKKKLLVFLLAGTMILQSSSWAWAEELTAGTAVEDVLVSGEKAVSDVITSGEPETENPEAEETEVEWAKESEAEEKSDPEKPEMEMKDVQAVTGRIPKTEDVNAVGAVGSVAVDAAHFPDDKFREAVKGQFDTDKDGKLSSTEIAAVTEMDISGKEIKSLNGIEYFTSLTSLDCSSNNLDRFDAFRVPNLMYLRCANSGEFASLDVTSLTSLTELYCGSNNLTTLKVAGLSKLARLDCSGNDFTSLDTSGLSSLRILECMMGRLKALDLTDAKALVMLECSRNKITSLDVRNLPNLQTLYCSNNMLESLDLLGDTNLISVRCNGNFMTGIDKIKNIPSSLDAGSIYFEPQEVLTLQTPVMKGVYNSAAGILVKWKGSSVPEGYYVYRKTGNGSWTKIKTIENEKISMDYEFSYMDTSVKNNNGTSYTYTVRAYGGGKQSDYDKSGKTVVRLMTPTLNGVYNSKDGCLVKWSPVSSAEGYYVFRKDDSGEWEQIAAVKGGNTASYMDGAVSERYGSTYAYTVKAYKGKYSSAYNGTGKTLIRLKAPEFTSCMNRPGKKIEMKWKQNTAMKGYEVQYSVSGNFADSKSVILPGDASGYSITGTVPGKQYYIRIRSFVKVGNSNCYSTWNVTSLIAKRRFLRHEF